MKVSIASDHAGYELRKLVVAHLVELGYEVLEGGADTAALPFSYVEAGQKIAEDVLEGNRHLRNRHRHLDRLQQV